MVEALETARLILGNWNLRDAPALFAYAKDPEVGPNAGWAPHRNVMESMSIIRNTYIPNRVWKIMYKIYEDNDGSRGTDTGSTETGRDRHRHIPQPRVSGAIGTIGFYHDRRRPDIRSMEMGYSLAKDYWGMGLMSEAVEAVLDYGFTSLGLDVISINTAVSNARSRRVIEKAGFVYEGMERRSNRIYDGSIQDLFIYSLLREEWERRER